MQTNYLTISGIILFLTLNVGWAQHQAPSQSLQHGHGENLSAGEREMCKTEVTQATIEYEKNLDRKAFNQKLQRYLNSPSRTHREFAIQIHIVTRDDGTGGIDIATVRNEIENYVNPYFTDIQASFVECNPENYIASTEYYNLSGGSEGDDMANEHNVANVFNIYFVNDPDGACGWARFPWMLPDDYIVIANGCASNQSTLVHEIGHYFGLYHTHETGVGDGAENVTRDDTDGCWNCETAGDLLCDTDADPRLNKDHINISASCVYSTDSLYQDGCNVTYTPDPENIMSYSRKSCRTIFSPEQYARMEVYMDGDRDYLQRECPCERPEAICQNITVNLDGSGNASIVPGDVDNGSTWDCGLDSWSVSPNSFDCNDVGANTVTLSVTDSLGWVSTCEATVTIADVTDPVITNPASDMTVECDGEGNTAAYLNWLSNNGGATATDACGGSWSNDATGLSNGCGATGSETVTFTYTDPSSNSASTSATFTIEDNTPPSVTCPDDIHLPECDSIATWVVEASDQCGDVTVVSNPPSGSEFPKGTTTTVTVTVTDDCGNVTTCDFEVERDPDLVVDIDPVPTSPLLTCAVGTDAHIVLGYGGGPTCRTLTAVGSGGHAPYTYSWEAPAAVPGGSFTNANTASPTFCADFQTEHCVTYTFRVTVTDIHGCEETNEVEVHVVNLGVFGDGSPCSSPENPKVVLCHIPPQHPENQQTICISPNAVPAHYNGNPLAHDDDCLGDCDAVCNTETPEGVGAKRQGNADLSSSEQKSILYEMSVTPNPFTSSTTIQILARTDTEVQLAVFDVSGRMVANLYEGPLSRGVPNYIEFNSGRLQAGIYIAKLIGINGDTQSSTMVLVR